MNDPRQDTLLRSLDHSIATFAEMRTSDAVCVAAFDALKQARAKIELAFEAERRALATRETTASAA